MISCAAQAPDLMELRDTFDRTSSAMKEDLKRLSWDAISIENSRYLSTSFYFNFLGNRLQELAKTLQNWNSYGSPAPNALALKNAATMLTSLRLKGLIPDRVLPSAEGGVAFTFVSDTVGRAVIEALNDGEAYILLYDLYGNSRTIEWPAGEAAQQLGLEAVQRHLRSPELAAQC